MRDLLQRGLADFQIGIVKGKKVQEECDGKYDKNYNSYKLVFPWYRIVAPWHLLKATYFKKISRVKTLVYTPENRNKFDNSPLILDHDFTHRRESQEPTASECAAKRWRISSPCPNYGATTDFDNLAQSQQMCVFVSILSGKWNEWSVVLIAILWHYLYSEFVFSIVSCARSCWVTCKDLWPPTHGALKCLLFQRAIISNQHYNFLSENWKLTK